MDGIVRVIAGIPAGILGLYSLLIFVRIILTWFSPGPSGRQAGITGKFTEFLFRITDPYLNWWRQKLGLRLGNIDLSPLAGIAALSVAQTIFTEISRQGKISFGIILGILLSAAWSVVSFILGFCLIIVILRIIAYFSGANVYSNPFWRTVNSISLPLLYHVNRILFVKKFVDYRISLISAVTVFAVLLIGGSIIVKLLTGILFRMPGP